MAIARLFFSGAVTSEAVLSGPGISFKRQLVALPDSAIQLLFDPPLLDLFKLVDKNLLAGESLRNLASRLLDPRTVLSIPKNQQVLIENLSLEKRRELAQRMLIDEQATVRQIILEIAAPTGMEALLEFSGVESEEPHAGPVPSQNVKVEPHYGLFDYQRRICEKAWAKLETPPRTVLLHLPTGGGKTRTAMHLVARHLNTYGPALVVWLAHSGELLEQAATEFEKAWQSLGNRPVELLRMWGSYDPDPLAVKDGIIVAGLQKLHFYKQRDLNAFLQLADRTHLTIIDEAHIAVAPTYQDLVTGLWSKRHDNRLLGLTATPGRTWSDITVDQELSSLFNFEKVTLEIDGYSSPVSYLLDAGYLARPNFKLLNTKPGLSLSEAEQTALAERFEVSESVLDRLGENPIRNLRIVEAVKDLLARHRRVLVFAPSVNSAKAIMAVLAAQDYEALCVTGATPAGERRRAIDLYRSDKNEPIVMCNYGVLTTGFDAPKTSAAVIARPTLSLVLYSQMVGRALRGPKANGNKDAEILTVVDPELPGFGRIEEAFRNWEDVWHAAPN